jgi:hypothetical protein
VALTLLDQIQAHARESPLLRYLSQSNIDAMVKMAREVAPLVFGTAAAAAAAAAAAPAEKEKKDDDDVSSSPATATTGPRSAAAAARAHAPRPRASTPTFEEDKAEEENVPSYGEYLYTPSAAAAASTTAAAAAGASSLASGKLTTVLHERVVTPAFVISLKVSVAAPGPGAAGYRDTWPSDAA